MDTGEVVLPSDYHETYSVRRSHAVSNYRPSSPDELRIFLYAD